MNKQIEVIQNILPLLETIQEGIEHTKKQLAELRYEEAFILLQDVVQGIISIENALEPMKAEFKKLQDNHIKQKKQDLNQLISQAVSLYEKGKYEEVEKGIDQILSAFMAWSESIQEIIKPNTVS